MDIKALEERVDSIKKLIEDMKIEAASKPKQIEPNVLRNQKICAAVTPVELALYKKTVAEYNAKHNNFHNPHQFARAIIHHFVENWRSLNLEEIWAKEEAMIYKRIHTRAVLGSLTTAKRRVEKEKVG